MNLIHLLILRGHSSGMNADLPILAFLIVGALVAFITTSNVTGSMGRLAMMLFAELVVLAILSRFYFPAAAAIGLGWVLMLAVIGLYHATEKKK